MEFDFDEFDYVEEEWPRDIKIDEVKEKLVDFFGENYDEVYHMQQLAVFFERKPHKYFHWITMKGINELLEEGDLLGSHEENLKEETRVKFVYNRKQQRYVKRKCRSKLEIIKKYSNPETTRACGMQAEMLFMNAFACRGFTIEGRNIREYNDREWRETDHNLDFIMKKDGKVYGCEVKNKLRYIESEELKIKLNICDRLLVKPLFIMRIAPKSYNYEIIRRGGFSLIFECQIYSYGDRDLVRKIRDILDLPVDCPREIPSGIIDRFMNWHSRKS